MNFYKSILQSLTIVFIFCAISCNINNSDVVKSVKVVAKAQDTLYEVTSNDFGEWLMSESDSSFEILIYDSCANKYLSNEYKFRYKKGTVYLIEIGQIFNDGESLIPLFKSDFSNLDEVVELGLTPKANVLRKVLRVKSSILENQAFDKFSERIVEGSIEVIPRSHEVISDENTYEPEKDNCTFFFKISSERGFIDFCSHNCTGEGYIWSL